MKAVQAGSDSLEPVMEDIRKQAREEYDDETDQGLAIFRAYLEEIRRKL